MLSIVLKTVIIFILVTLIIHLLIKKALSNQDNIIPPPVLNHEEISDSVTSVQSSESSIEDMNVIQSSTSIKPPQSLDDDLFNFVYKKKNETPKEVEKSEKKVEVNKVEVNKVEVNKVEFNNKIDCIEGICAFDDENTMLFGSYNK